MSVVPSGIAPFFHIRLYTSVQVAVTSAALYDHVLSLGREVDLIWMKPPSLVTALYVLERYLGDIVLIWSVPMLLSVYVQRRVRECVRYRLLTTQHALSIRCMQLFQFRAWGALVYSWATQGIMQLRIYAMYRQSRRILILLVITFICEIAAIAFIIAQEIGPGSHLEAVTIFVPGERLCIFLGISGHFIYIFIPFLCYELFLFVLAARMFVRNMRRRRDTIDEVGVTGNTFVGVLTRDSLRYFSVNLVACAVVMGLWQGVTELYANICIPFVMFLEVLVGTRLILNFRERYARPDVDPVVSVRHSSLHFREDDLRLDSVYISVQCQIETVVVTDTES